MYRNRAGEYTVMAVDGDKLTIRYVSGTTITTSVSIQARIWENIQYEEQAAREEERVRLAQEARLASRKRATKPAPAPAAEKPAAPPRTRGRFGGFLETDFQPKARGIAWPGRVALGGALANELSGRTGRVFGKWLVPLLPEVHIARPEYYDPDVGGRNAAFFVSVSEKGAAYGFRVGKLDGRVEASWPWSVLIATLAGDADLRGTVESVMSNRGLSMDVYAMEVSYGPVAHITLSRSGSSFMWERETSAETMRREMSWDDLLEYLQTVSANARTDLYVRNTLSKEDAVSAGPGIARDVLAALTALLPVYDACLEEKAG